MYLYQNTAVYEAEYAHVCDLIQLCLELFERN